MPKLRVFNLGTRGINVRESPLHLEDGELRLAQNAELSRDLGETGLVKRGGIEEFTPDALAAGVAAIVSIPLPDPWVELPAVGDTLLAPTSTDGSSNQFLESTDNGATWDPFSSPPFRFFAGYASPVTSMVVSDRGGAQSNVGSFFYLIPSTDFELYEWDGQNNTLLASGARGGNETSVSLVRHQDAVYILISDTIANTGRLLKYDGSSTLQAISGSIPQECSSACDAQGSIFIGTDNSRVYTWNSSDGFVLDETFTPSNRVAIQSLAHFNFEVYAAACSHGATSTDWKVMKRSADGTWTDITPSANGDYGPLCVLGSNIYVARGHGGAGFTGCQVHRYDGATWTLDKDFVADVDAGCNHISVMLAFNNRLIIECSSTTGGFGTFRIARRSNGVWSVTHEVSGAAPDCPNGSIGFL